MIKKLLSIALIAAAVSANAQQFKIAGKVPTNHVVARSQNPNAPLNVIDTLYPASVMPGGCVSSTVTTVGGLYNYICDFVTPNDSGYIFGTGLISIGPNAATSATELAQKYNVTGAAQVTQVLVWAGVAHGTTATTTAKIYTENTTSHKPNTLLGTSTPLLMSAYNTTGYTSYTFGTPVNVSAGNFFAGITVPAFGGTDLDTLSILATNLGGCPAAGSDSASAMKFGAPINSWYLVKTAFGVNGDLMIFPVLSIASGINNSVSKGDLTLYAASPNPATNSININFSLNNASKVDIEVYDVTGQVVKTVKGTDVLANGKHSISLDVTNLTSGSYMYSISMNSSKMFSKFVVTK